MFYHVLILLLDRNECDNFPCQNGGMCINNDGSFTCVCKDGWEGAECQNGMAFPYITQVTNYSLSYMYLYRKHYSSNSNLYRYK